MKQKRTKSTLFAFLLPVLLFSSCAPGEETGLSDGKYPITFTAQVDGLTATRATSDNSWAGGEEVAIQIGSEVKTYTAASDGNLTVASSGTPFYWQNTNDITVSAWYPYNITKPTDGALTVNADQRGDGYQASDYLEAAETTVTFGSSANLIFKHRTAKVVVTLKAGGGVTDISGATVKFLNQIGVEGGGTEVTPKFDNNTYSALLIPQNLQNNKFISVTLSDGNGGSNTYYYTPTQENEANLQGGKQYTYDITVKHGYLSVTSSASPQWTGDGETITGNGQTVTPGTDGNGSGWTQDGSDETITGTEKSNNP